MALTLVTLEPLDVSLFFPPPLRKAVLGIRRVISSFLIFRLAMTGCLETAEEHWWIDTEAIAVETFTEFLMQTVAKIFPRARLFVVRDFIEGNPTGKQLEQALLEQGFKNLLNLPLAVIELGSLTPEQYYLRLRKRVRASIRRMQTIAREHGLTVERCSEFRHLVDELYPLYLQVHNKASELPRPPFPLEFFRLLAEELNDVVTIATVRLPDDHPVAFILTGIWNDTASAYLLGLDYEVSQDLWLYHNLVWDSIVLAANRGAQKLDLGVSSYFVKQSYGAVLKPMAMVASSQNRLLRRALNPLLPKLFSAPQPKLRKRSPSRGEDDATRPD